LAKLTCRSGEIEDWQENNLVIDRGDGSPLNPDTLSSRWAGFLRRAVIWSMNSQVRLHPGWLAMYDESRSA
jgi:hypothetical protein